jgi:hypothetical protein
MLQPSPQYMHVHRKTSYRKKSCLDIVDITLPLNLKQNSVHLVNKNHSPQNFSEVDRIVLYFFIQ